MMNQSREANKNKTLRTLFNVICQDNEFALLRRTLEIYAEEIQAHDMKSSNEVLNQFD